MFGPNWYSSLQSIKLLSTGCSYSADWGACIPTSVNVWNTDGSREFYQLKPSASDPFVYTASGSSSGGSLVYEPYTQWTLIKNLTTYVYSHDGYLQSIEGPLGLKLTFQYSPSNPAQLIKVTNSAGQYVNFNWTGSRVTSIVDSNGGQWLYTYNSNNMLDTVTSPGALPSVRKYHYESSVGFTLLTGISINGVRYSTYAYDQSRRAIESGLAGGEDRDTFAYGLNTTSLTSAAGQATTYTFAPAGGAVRLTNVARSGTTSCGPSSAATFYDANGYIDYTLDWNGEKTDYSYDSSGRLSAVTYYPGKSAQLKKVNTWAGDKLMESTFSNASGTAFYKISYAYVSHPGRS